MKKKRENEIEKEKWMKRFDWLKKIMVEENRKKKRGGANLQIRKIEGNIFEKENKKEQRERRRS